MVLFRGEVCTIASTLSNAATALCLSTGELSSHDETNTAEMIDQMFEEVLEYAGRMEEERRDNEDTEDRDSGIGNYSGDKSKMDTESEKERSEEEEGEQPEKKSLERGGENEALETSEDELLTFPPSGILSPLSKSVEAVVTPLVGTAPVPHHDKYRILQSGCLDTRGLSRALSHESVWSASSCREPRQNLKGPMT